MSEVGSSHEVGLSHLLARVQAVEQRIRALVAARRADDPQPGDPYRGLYLSADTIDRLLAHGPREPLAPAAADAPATSGRLGQLAEDFGLTGLDEELLLVALACELDTRFEQFFGYLNDDVTRRRPSVATALALCGQDVAAAGARNRLRDGPLVTGRLVQIEDRDRPFPGRALRVPDRVVAHLLGDDAPDPALAGVLAETGAVEWGDAAPLLRALRSGRVRVAYLREPATGSGQALGSRALAGLGRDVLVVDLERLTASADAVELAAVAGREAALRHAGLIVGPVGPTGVQPAVVEALGATSAPLLLVGSVSWDPAWCRLRPLQVEVEASTPGERTALWRQALADADSVDPAAATEQFLLRPEQVIQAARAAVVQATLTGGTLEAAHLQAGARGANGSALQRLARRIEPAVGWQDLVLPATTRDAIAEVALRARHRERVLGEWAMRPGGGRGMGVAALFAGDSGTGKTMSAEVIARELGLDLYVVDLATVVDKYVGETEKNLEKIFTAAAGINGVLLFDEADAIFGKRSEVKDAHDRYANVESAYLLQRMESFDGLVILSTNLRANIDDAFTRRLDVLVDFALPDAVHRHALWDRCLGEAVPRAAELDLAFCAESFEMAGGAIRSAAVTAAYLAAEGAGEMTMEHVVTAVQREYRKMGRLCLEQEFGRYHALIA